MKRFFILAVTVTASLIVNPVQAQRTGSRIGKNLSAAKPQDAIVALNALAHCAVRRNKPFVTALLNTVPGSAEAAKLSRKAENELLICYQQNDREITSADLFFDRTSLRTQLAIESMRLQSDEVVAQASLPTEKAWFDLPDYRVADADMNVLAIQRFGQCVLTANPAAGIALVRAKERTADEKQAVANLIPILGTCITNGRSMQLTAISLRAALAEPSYRIVVMKDGKQ